MEIKTHASIDQSFCGTPQELGPGFARLQMVATPQMAADETSLVHGGFVFGMADYAAMLAVNHPNVVLGSVQISFVKPVRVGDTLEAFARVTENKGRKYLVSVEVKGGDVVVLNGLMTCFVPEKHVLAP